MENAPPIVTAVEMGYGHLRAAHALADALGTEVLLADRPPLITPDEERLWRASRRVYEATSRASQLPLLGGPLRSALEALTAIPHLHPQRDLSAPTLQTRWLDRLIGRGLGRGLARRAAATGAPVLSTFFSAAMAVDRATPADREHPVYCVVTDVDVSRAWVPREPQATRIVYLTPSRRAVHRLRAYGVPHERIEFTGFPLPGELLGGPDLPRLRQNLAARLARLDRKGEFRSQARGEIHQFLGEVQGQQSPDRSPLLTFTLGGAGAQAELARPLLRSLAPLVDEGRLRLALVAGLRREVAARFERWTEEAGCGRHLGDAITVHASDNLDDYFRSFNQLLAETDILWTKPSEMTFYGALGIPLIFSYPVGVHEGYNRRWAIENGVGLKQRDPHQAGFWMREWLNEGTLAAAAWFGFLRCPKFGLYQILDRLRRDGALAAAPSLKSAPPAP